MNADLHIHSTFSDGSETIERIIEMAKERKLDAIAITDHDTISHMSSIPCDAGINVIHGVELSTVHRKTNTYAEVLGYNIRDPEMIAALPRESLKAQGGSHEKRCADVIEAVRAIKESGGVSVLAHPGRQQNFRIIPELVEAGLGGLELNHSANSPKDREAILEYAALYGLFLTGGSDYHGRNDTRRVEIGHFLSEDSGAMAICPSIPQLNQPAGFTSPCP